MEQCIEVQRNRSQQICYIVTTNVQYNCYIYEAKLGVTSFVCYLMMVYTIAAPSNNLKKKSEHITN